MFRYEAQRKVILAKHKLEKYLCLQRTHKRKQATWTMFERIRSLSFVRQLLSLFTKNGTTVVLSSFSLLFGYVARSLYARSFQLLQL